MRKVFNNLLTKIKKISKKLNYIDNDNFKNAMSNFTTGITIVATKKSDELHGITINSFASVSLKPPLILYCLEKSSTRYSVFSKSKFFTVNILSKKQQELAKKFVNHEQDNWDEVKFDQTNHGNPIIKDCLYTIECEHEKNIDAGDHIIILAKVISLKENKQQEKPLIYFRRDYNKI